MSLGGGAILNVPVVQTLQECIALAVQEIGPLRQALTRAVHACVAKALHGYDMKNMYESVQLDVQDCIEFSIEESRDLLACLIKDAELTVRFCKKYCAAMQESAPVVTNQLPTTETLFEQLNAVTMNLTDSAMNQINEHPIVAGCLFGAVSYSMYRCLRSAYTSTSSTHTPNRNHKNRRKKNA